MRLILIILLISIASTANATQILVPSEQPTIQDGINTAINGDTVKVAPGTYVENIDFLGKTIVLMGSGGILDYQSLLWPANADPTITISPGSGLGTEISGFLIEEVYEEFTPPLLIQDSELRIHNNVFRHNHTSFDHLAEAVIKIEGGLTQKTVLIENNLFYHNRGIACVSIMPGGYAEIIKNTISDNFRGVITTSEHGSLLHENMITFSVHFGISGTFSELSCNNIFGNTPNYENGATPGSGDISSDPEFCNKANLDFGLMESSPCLPDNNSCAVLIGLFGVNCTNDCADTDEDGWCRYEDNCAQTYNPDQLDTESDGIGDLCDNCPLIINFIQADTDDDGIGDDCDNCPDDPFNDFDLDGICGDIDNCPGLPNPTQEDLNFNGIGDTCETCCVGSAGDLNLDDATDISDLVFLVDYMFRGGPEPYCPGEGNLDGLFAPGPINVSDLSYIVDFFFRGGPPPATCQ